MGRTRLTGFFVLIVVVPMIAVGFLVFRLIGDGAQGKAASLGVVSSGDGDKHALVAAADRALYEAKRSGKNQTRRGSAQTANVFSGE